jgi:hypothetical protein
VLQLSDVVGLPPYGGNPTTCDRGVLFAGSRPLVDTNDRCVVVRVSVLSEGVLGTLNIQGTCKAIVLYLSLAVSFLSFCLEGVSKFCLI